MRGCEIREIRIHKVKFTESLKVKKKKKKGRKQSEQGMGSKPIVNCVPAPLSYSSSPQFQP